MSALEAQILFARALVLLLMYGFLTMVGWLAWAELRRQGAASVVAAAPAARLVIIEGADAGWPPGTAFPLEPISVIGRDLDAGVVLQDATLSSRHAMLSLDHDGWWVEDLGSRNGTYVNAERAEPGTPMPARSGDEVRLGAVRMRLVVPAS